MTKINVHDAKTHLSRYLSRVEQGETIIVCRRNEPIAELRPIRSAGERRRPLGLAQGQFEIPDSFFEPLPNSLEEAFSGHGP